MTRQDIESKVNDILTDKLGIAPEDIKSEADFREDLGGDSLDLVTVVMELEKDLRISVTDEDTDRVKTVADIYELVGKYTGGH